MATGIVIAGGGTLNLDGRPVAAKAMKVKVQSKKFTKVTSSRGVLGDKVEVVVPTLTATIIADNDTSVAWLASLQNVTVEGQTDSGRSFVLEGASISNEPEYDFDEGTIDIEMQGMSGEETGV